jgi:Ser/Thr protein kinase RdoA (MazF antagonist)
MEFLLGSVLPPEYKARFEALGRALADRIEADLRHEALISVHGDCHLGNALWQQDSPFFLDFDDAMTAPPVQDIWMVVRGRGEEAERDRNALLEGYEAFRPFPRATLSLIEPLRALRMMHYSAWIARRWDDPSFPRAFPLFGSARYWEEEMQAMQEILAILGGRE